MFGRRNPDQPLAAPISKDERELDLDVLPELTVSMPPRPAQATQPLPNVTHFAPEWSPGSTTEPGPQQRSAPEPTPFVPTSPGSASGQAFSPPAPPVRPRAATESVIGPDDFFDGAYRSERGVRIQGNVRGSIESHQYIFVEASAQVAANLSAEDITIAGNFDGKIECRHRLEITSSGKVHGHVETALLVVQEGGLLDGELQMGRSVADTAA